MATERPSGHRLWPWALFRRSAHAQPSGLLIAGKPVARSAAAISAAFHHFRLEVIQELWFPTSCGRVKFSADSESMIATGCYPPQSRVYELRELSLKFSHHFVADIVQFQILSPDWKKLAYLLSDRTIELHSQFGKHHTVRVPHHGRDLAYQPETCELLVGGDGPELS